MLAWAQDFRDVHPQILHFPAFRSCWLGPNHTHSWGQLAKARKVQKTRGNLRNSCRSAGLPRRPPPDSSLFELFRSSWSSHTQTRGPVRVAAHRTQPKPGKVQKTRGYVRNPCMSAGLPGRPPLDSSLSSTPLVSLAGAASLSGEAVGKVPSVLPTVPRVTVPSVFAEGAS